MCMLRTESCHAANFVISGGTAGCHDNLQCLVALQVVMTTCSAARDDKVGSMTIVIIFQYMHQLQF